MRCEIKNARCEIKNARCQVKNVRFQLSHVLRLSMLDSSIMEMLIFTAIVVVDLLVLTNCVDDVLPNHIPRNRPIERISSFVDTLLAYRPKTTIAYEQFHQF